MLYSHDCSQLAGENPRQDSPTHQNQLLERQKGNRRNRGSEVLKQKGNLHSDPARKNSVAINRIYIACILHELHWDPGRKKKLLLEPKTIWGREFGCAEQREERGAQGEGRGIIPAAILAVPSSLPPWRRPCWIHQNNFPAKLETPWKEK